MNDSNPFHHSYRGRTYLSSKQLKLEPAYGKQGWWESYAGELLVEYRQCLEEGKVIEKYQHLFDAVNQMPPPVLGRCDSDRAFG